MAADPGGCDSSTRRVLIVDGDPELVTRVPAGLPSVEVATVKGGEAAFRFLSRYDVDALALDPSIGMARVVELSVKLRHRVAGAQLVLLAGTSPPDVVEVFQDICFARLARDAPADTVAATLCRALELCRGMPLATDWPGIVGSSPSLARSLARMENLRTTSRTALFAGPAGAGKSLCAAALHAGGPRGAGRFIVVACDRADEASLQRELFGPEPGAFDERLAPPAALARARGGTIFLDQIHVLPWRLQDRIAAVIEGDASLTPGVRAQSGICFLASTQYSLEAIVSEQILSRHLLQVVEDRIEIPPLAERPEDIEPLAGEFVRRAALREGVPVPVLSGEFLRALSAHTWEGNVRELRAEVTRAVTLRRTGPPVRSRT